MSQQNNPLHGVKLETIVNDLVDKYGWEALAERININCFKDNPSVKSSLKFLRRTQWARDKVEYLWLKSNKLPLPKPKYPKDSAPIASNTASSSNETSGTQVDDPQVNADIWGK